MTSSLLSLCQPRNTQLLQLQNFFAFLFGSQNLELLASAQITGPTSAPEVAPFKMPQPLGKIPPPAPAGRPFHSEDPDMSPKHVPSLEGETCQVSTVGAKDELQTLKLATKSSMISAFLGRVCIRIQNRVRGFVWLSLFVAACMALFWERFATYMYRPSHEIVG
jgi:hypothetical protein